LKGGTAKTVLAANLAYGLSRRLPRGKRLLAVDCDPQSDLSRTLLDGQEAGGATLTDVLEDNAQPIDAVRPSRLEGVDLLPSDMRLADCTTTLASAMGRERRLGLALAALEKRYEIAVLDAPAQLSLLVVNLLEASNEIIIPTECGSYSAAGVARLEDTVRAARKYLGNETLRIIGIVLSKVQRNRAAKALERQFRETYGSIVFDVTIPLSVQVEEAVSHNRTVLEWAPASPASIAFAKLVSEVSANGHAKDHPRAGNHAKDRAGARKRRAG
jgi:chromosome partitioning protein